MSLGLEAMVNVEVRDASGVVTSFSHDYPIDASSLLRIPSLSRRIRHHQHSLSGRYPRPRQLLFEAEHQVLRPTFVVNMTRVQLEHVVKADHWRGLCLQSLVVHLEEHGYVQKKRAA